MEDIKNKQLDEIEKYIDDIYALRKEGLATGSEWSIGNLVFKEIRNKGYLDNLKDLKNDLIGKELSLESLEEAFNEDLATDTYTWGEWGAAIGTMLGGPIGTVLGAIGGVGIKLIGELIKKVIQRKKENKTDFANDAEIVNSLDKIEDKLGEKKTDKLINAIDKKLNVNLEPALAEALSNRNNCNDLLTERLEDDDRYSYRTELARISHNQPVIQDNGLFHIYQVREDDERRITSQIRNLPYIEWVQSSAGAFDFSHVAAYGPQKRYYTIYGKIKDKD